MAQLKDFCKKGASNIAQKDLENNTGIYPIYGASGLIKYVDFYVQEKPYIAVVKDGAGVGRVMKLPAYSSVIGTLQYIIPNDDIDVNYLAYAMENMNLSKYYMGAAIPHIYFKDYCNEKMPLHTAKEQQEIADTLDKICELIKNRKQQISKHDELVKARFVEMFGDPESNSKKWAKEPLSKHLNVVGGYAFKSELFTEEGIPVLRIGNINAGFFQAVNMVYWKKDDSLSRYMMYPGDLVMSLTGTVGKDDYGNVCVLGNNYESYYLNQRNAKLELFSSLDKYYLSQILKFPVIKKKLTGISRGVRQANISNKDILNLEIPIPPIELQNEFASFVKQIDKSKFEVQQSLEKLETLKKSLMQQYFG